MNAVVRVRSEVTQSRALMARMLRNLEEAGLGEAVKTQMMREEIAKIDRQLEDLGDSTHEL